MSVLIGIKKTCDVLLPEYATKGSAGLDLRAYVREPVILNPGKIGIIPTGIAISLPDGYEGQIRSRSGMSFKHGITVLNSPGTIDSDYRGEIKIIIINLGEAAFEICNKMKIAQFVVSKVSKVKFVELETLDVGNSERNDRGFGSTGEY